jgi:hypothetical protein
MQAFIRIMSANMSGAPHGDLDVVSAKDGKLWSQFGKDHDEYLPLGAEAFFIRSDLGTVTFVRDPEGHVTGLHLSPR